MKKEIGETLRIHHLLCIPLYKGNGYSGAFCENMDNRIKWLLGHPDVPLLAVCSADMICAGCPNLMPENMCRSSGGNVDKKDRKLAELLEICPGKKYTYREMMCLAKKNLTEKEFNNSCKNCDWYAKGLCSYGGWTRGYCRL